MNELAALRRYCPQAARAILESSSVRDRTPCRHGKKISHHPLCIELIDTAEKLRHVWAGRLRCELSLA